MIQEYLVCNCKYKRNIMFEMYILPAAEVSEKAKNMEI